MKRFFKWLFLLAFLAGIGWVGLKWYQAQSGSVAAFTLIPPDAIYCIATDDPQEAWTEVAQSGFWNHLKGNAYFASLTSSAYSLDSMIRGNDLLFNMIGSRALLVSAHMTDAKHYDFLFVVDLKGASGIKFMKDYLTEFSTEGYRVKKEKYGDEDLISLYDPSDTTTLFISLPGTNLLASYSKKIVTSALDTQAKESKEGEQEASKKGAIEAFERVEADIGKNGIMRLYLNYSRLPDLMNCYSSTPNEYVTRISQILLTSGLSLQLQGDLLKAEGNTYVNDSVESYIKTLEVSGDGPTDITQVAPQRTAFYLGFGFKSFPEFFVNLEKNLKQDVSSYDEYKSNLKQVEDYLKISLQKNFIDWIGDEVAIFELQSSGKGEDSEVALVLKADNIEKAKSDLAYIEKMVRRRTPVKFKTIDHQGYKINYLSMKGLFKVVFGKFFARYDKPYYTIINNYVIFSNHPQTLESIIDDFLEKKTLAKSDEFRDFRKEFDDNGSAFVYVNTPVLFNSMKKLADASTRNSMEANKDYIICFRQIGFQLVPGEGRFKTLFAEKFVKPEGMATITIEDTPVDTVVDKTMELNVDDDPMALPYLYVQNLNEDSYTGYFADSTTVQFKVELKNGFKDGSYTEYYESSKVKMKGHFSHDARDGTWRLYDESGNLVLTRKYEEGVIRKEKKQED